MTSIVGVLCSDGIVIGTDSSATFATADGHTGTIEQYTEKIHIASGKVIVAGTGAVGLSQRFNVVVDTAWTDGRFDNIPTEVGKALSAAMIKDLTATSAPRGQYGALVAFPCRRTAQLCEFAVADCQPELKTPQTAWYCSMGSAQRITDPFLGLIRDVFWTKGPPTTARGNLRRDLDASTSNRSKHGWCQGADPDRRA